MNEILLAPRQRLLAIQRITALWAFCESGLGGVLHALRMPFTGLLVGSFSVLCITLLAWLSEGKYRKVLHSLLLALIVKAVVSPHSPPTAYLAVAFQGLAGYGIYKALAVRSFSVYLFAVIALLESALQKLLTLTLFFGKSFWKAANELVRFVGKELSVALPLGSVLLTVLYVGVYLVGAIFCGRLALRLLADFGAAGNELPPPPALEEVTAPAQKRGRRRKLIFVALFFLVGVVLYVGSGNKREGALAVAQAATWTACALLLWYGLLAPVALGLLRRYLLAQRARHGTEVQEVLRLLPDFRRLSVAAWRRSGEMKGNRISFFVRLLVHWSLTWHPVELQSETA